MINLESHINELFHGIPDSNRKTEIMQEIGQNTHDKAAELVSQGLSEEDAWRMAIEDIGDVNEIKRELVSNSQILHIKKIGFSLSFSVWGSLILSAFFIFLNFYYSPNTIWFVYPLFAVVWWPMSMFFYWLGQRNRRSMIFPYATAGTALIVSLMLFINFYYTPEVIWFVYPMFAVIWWPVATGFYRLRQRNREDR